MRSDVLLARHGRTAWHSPNRYAGSSDIPLDEVGTQQATALADWSRRAALTHLVSSPLQRTMTTAAAVASKTGLDVQVVEEFRELHFGIAEGRTVDELRASHPGAVAEFLVDPVENHWPDGEDPRVRAREAANALVTLGKEHAGGRILVVMHSTLIRLVMCELLGIPLQRYRDVLARPEPAYITRVSVDEANCVLMRYNCPPHDSFSSGS